MNTSIFRRTVIGASILGLFAGAAGVAGADEGMWLLNQPPTGMIAERYGVQADPEWFEHLQKSAVKFGSGGSASFISADGLVLTNHHVARDQMGKLSTAERDILRDGFLARSREEELRFPDIALMCLQQIEDVTQRVMQAGAAAADDAAAETARKAEIAAIEKESQAATGLFSQVVTLYGGGKYHLYRYDRFTDVRLVFAPEGDIAHFGGDTDNFEFPRFCLDMTIVRVYDKSGQPYKPTHHLKWSTDGIVDGEPVFVVGHPGSTQRQFTADHLRFQRDELYPMQMHFARGREVELTIFSNQSEDNARQAVRDLMGHANWRKGTGGKLRALQDPAIFGAKEQDEAAFREAVSANPELQKAYGGAWDRIATAQDRAEALYREYFAAEGRRGSYAASDLVRIARTIVRSVEDQAKPDGQRLPEYTDANRANVDLIIDSAAPVLPALEIDRITSHLAFAAEILGCDHPVVKTMLGGKSPEARARELVTGTSLGEPAARRSLVSGGMDAIKASDDAMIRFTMAIDPAARAIRKKYENEVEAVEKAAYAQLAAARFAIHGDSVYPDATGTLRLGTGRVRGFDQEGTFAHPVTNFAGLYDRFDARKGSPQFELPERWVQARDRINPDVAFNFVSTNDIIGGNSGSPIVNATGELVGLIFDGNRYAFVWDTVYTGERGRAVSVDARGMLEALTTVYGATDLVNEIRGR
jgi:hypothetical protein